MACLLKPPTNGTPGVVTFTTQERDHIIRHDDQLRSRIEALKPRWLVGLHHNWHDWRFDYDALYDFSMAGEEDLRERRGQPFELVPLDACNFSPPDFHPASSDKFWDILYVARPAFFKRIPEFLDAVRQLYDRGLDYRVLLITPMPEYDPAQAETVFYGIRDRYDELFSPVEQDRFTLLTLTFRYPFPFDLPTLGHFYRSSRVFMHTADDERRCRVAAYAWASGLPVVGMDAVASLLPPALRHEPYWFRVGDGAGFADQAQHAVETATAGVGDFGPAREITSADFTPGLLEGHLARVAFAKGLAAPAGQLSDQGLDVRLGRHHGMDDGPNFIAQTIDDLLRYLCARSDADLAADLAHDDPERFVATLEGYRSESVGEEVRGTPPVSLLARVADRARAAVGR